MVSVKEVYTANRSKSESLVDGISCQCRVGFEPVSVAAVYFLPTFKLFVLNAALMFGHSNCNKIEPVE